MENKQTYSQKLKDPRWQRVRLQILQRDDFTCKKCGDKNNTLHVHHKYYDFGKDPWDYKTEVLVTLCEGCHSEEEEAKGNKQEIIRAFLEAGHFNTELDHLAALLQGAINFLGTSLFHDVITDLAIRGEINEILLTAIAAIPKPTKGENKEPTEDLEF